MDKSGRNSSQHPSQEIRDQTPEAQSIEDWRKMFPDAYDEKEHWPSLGRELRKHRKDLPLGEWLTSNICMDIISSRESREHAYAALTAEFDGVLGDGGLLWKSDDYACGLIGHLLLWYLDLPASESHHHNGRFGLFDHTLEVGLSALIAFRDLLGTCRSCGGYEPCALDYLARALVTVAFAHDADKTRTLLKVTAPTTGEVWNPLKEPLFFFKHRNRLPILEPTPHVFIPGRGLGRQVKRGRPLVMNFIHSKYRPEMRSVVLETFDTYASWSDEEGHRNPSPYGFLAYLVRQADGDSTSKFMMEKPPVDYLMILSATFANLPESMTGEPGKNGCQMVRHLIPEAVRRAIERRHMSGFPE